MPYIPKSYNATEQQIELLKLSIETLHNRIDKIKETRKHKKEE